MVNRMKDTNKDRFEVYNKSSEKMEEVANASIDLVVTDPPFNIGCHFGEMVDDSSHQEYIGKIQRVTSELARVLSPKGLALFLVPTAIRRERQLYEYPKIYSDLCSAEDLRHIGNISYKVTEEDYDCVPEVEIRKNPLKGKSHSDAIVGLIFGKSKTKTKFFQKGKLYKYTPRDGHPCPYPQELVEDLMNTFYNTGDRVLDPFMGTGSLGVEVLKRSGKFVGYELNRDFYETAKRELKGVYEK
jgi:modification methylase